MTSCMMQPQTGIRVHSVKKGICQGHNSSDASASQSQRNRKESRKRVAKGHLFEIT